MWFWDKQFLSISKWEKDGSTAVRKKMLPHCQGSVPGSQVCPGAHSPLLSLLWRSLMGLLRGGNHLKAAMQCPTVKVVPKHGLNNADFYPARGESRLGSSLNNIPNRKCHLPYEICFWERILNRIIRRGRINMEKAPMDGQNHFHFSAVWCHIWWTEQCPSELAHTSLLSQSVMEGWELRHKYSHQGWKSPTANATTPFSLNYLHVGQVVLSLLLYTGSFPPLIPLKYTQLEWAAWSTRGCGTRGTHSSHLPRPECINSSCWELLAALTGKCKTRGKNAHFRGGITSGRKQMSLLCTVKHALVGSQQVLNVVFSVVPSSSPRIHRVPPPSCCTQSHPCLPCSSCQSHSVCMYRFWQL